MPLRGWLCRSLEPTKMRYMEDPLMNLFIVMLVCELDWLQVFHSLFLQQCLSLMEGHGTSMFEFERVMVDFKFYWGGKILA